MNGQGQSEVNVVMSPPACQSKKHAPNKNIHYSSDEMKASVAPSPPYSAITIRKMSQEIA